MEEPVSEQVGCEQQHWLFDQDFDAEWWLLQGFELRLVVVDAHQLECV
jgi:hypothetical protein